MSKILTNPSRLFNKESTFFVLNLLALIAIVLQSIAVRGMP